MKCKSLVSPEARLFSPRVREAIAVSILVFNCFPCAYLFFVLQVGTVARLLEAGGWRPAAAVTAGT